MCVCVCVHVYEILISSNLLKLKPEHSHNYPDFEEVVSGLTSPSPHSPFGSLTVTPLFIARLEKPNCPQKIPVSAFHIIQEKYQRETSFQAVWPTFLIVFL